MKTEAGVVRCLFVVTTVPHRRCHEWAVSISSDKAGPPLASVGKDTVEDWSLHDEDSKADFLSPPFFLDVVVLLLLGGLRLSLFFSSEILSLLLFCSSVYGRVCIIKQSCNQLSCLHTLKNSTRNEIPICVITKQRTLPFLIVPIKQIVIVFTNDENINLKREGVEEVA